MGFGGMRCAVPCGGRDGGDCGVSTIALSLKLIDKQEAYPCLRTISYWSTSGQSARRWIGWRTTPKTSKFVLATWKTSMPASQTVLIGWTDGCIVSKSGSISSKPERSSGENPRLNPVPIKLTVCIQARVGRTPAALRPLARTSVFTRKSSLETQEKRE